MLLEQVDELTHVGVLGYHEILDGMEKNRMDITPALKLKIRISRTALALIIWGAVSAKIYGHVSKAHESVAEVAASPAKAACRTVKKMLSQYGSHALFTCFHIRNQYYRSKSSERRKACERSHLPPVTLYSRQLCVDF